MRCPNCKKFNKNGAKTCFYCGFELDNNNSIPSWMAGFDGSSKSAKYVELDEFGNEVELKDSRDEFAEEMYNLRIRKLEGQKAQEHFRQAEKRRKEANRGHVGLAPEPLSELKANENTVRASEFSNNPIVNHVENHEYEQINNQVYDYVGNYNRQSNSNIRDKRIHKAKKRQNARFLFLIPIIALLIAIGYGAYSVIQYRIISQELQKSENQAKVFPSILNDLAAHTIMIPGKEGEQIYVKELHKSYLVTNGYATIEVSDYTWYENYEDFLNDTMEVTLSPFIKKTTGKLTPLDIVSFNIEIPLSPLVIVTPQSGYDTAITSLYRIEVKVRENSKLSINGEDFSDIVNTDDGNVTFNASVKPIGDNKFEITCKTQYCRSNTKVVVINRPVQEIPVDLATDISNISTYDYMTIKGSTIADAYISVQSPHSDLDITNINKNGSFKFLALFDKIGDNTITFSVSKKGAKTTVINYNVYYVPNIDIYSRKAWAMDDEHYNHLISTMAERVKRSQIYVCIGKLEEFIAQEPQIAIMNCGTDEKPLRVLLENKTNKQWTVGQSYRIYADIFGLYKDMPRLIARYTYPQ